MLHTVDRKTTMKILDAFLDVMYGLEDWHDIVTAHPGLSDERCKEIEETFILALNTKAEMLKWSARE
jgi:hypothetical protein